MVPIEGSEAVVGGLRLVAESTGGRRNQIDTILVCRVAEEAEPTEVEEPQTNGAPASGATASGATRVEEPAGAVER